MANIRERTRITKEFAEYVELYSGYKSLAIRLPFSTDNSHTIDSIIINRYSAGDYGLSILPSNRLSLKTKLEEVGFKPTGEKGHHHHEFLSHSSMVPIIGIYQNSQGISEALTTLATALVDDKKTQRAVITAGKRAIKELDKNISPLAFEQAMETVSTIISEVSKQEKSKG
ncbi:MAG: hypothetical protein H6908_01690 [Hyphomicrobiales bacterium]|nr:hypothetical protein [Rickettsiales bacterium]MCP5361346.1 hypothetical protein [Hyphomicrobiales bacterium]